LQYNNARDNCVNIYENLLKTKVMQELDKLVILVVILHEKIIV